MNPFSLYKDILEKYLSVNTILKLEEAWNEPRRKYHNIDHLRQILEDLEKKFDDLDIDVLTEVMRQFNEARFKIDDVNVVKCQCGKEQAYQFDELPGFLPESWFIEE